MRWNSFSFSKLTFSAVVAASIFSPSVRAEDALANDPNGEMKAVPMESMMEAALQEEAVQKPQAIAPEEKTPVLATETPTESPVLAQETPAAAGERVPASNRTRPEILTAPFEAEGFWVNAFYFVREEGETWNSVSEKLYGRADRKPLLQKWNPGKRVRIGQVIYYNSPARPDDSENMKVFAEDFGYQLDQVTIQKGDTLSKIGLARYGNVRTWKEISALNPDLANPDRVEVGQVIKLQPKDIDTKPVLSNIMKEVSEYKHKDQVDQLGQSAPETTAMGSVSDSSDKLPLPEAPVASVVKEPKEATAPGVALNNSAPNAPPAVATAQSQQSPASDLVRSAPVVARQDKASVHGNKPISFKTSSILGIIGTLLLVTALGMVGFRKLSKFRASKLTRNLPSSRGPAV